MPISPVTSSIIALTKLLPDLGLVLDTVTIGEFTFTLLSGEGVIFCFLYCSADFLFASLTACIWSLVALTWTSLNPDASVVSISLLFLLLKITKGNIEIPTSKGIATLAGSSGLRKFEILSIAYPKP